MGAFNFIIPKPVRTLVYMYSYFTKTINVLIWVLTKYENSFDLDEDDNKEFDIILSNLINTKLNNQITKISDELLSELE